MTRAQPQPIATMMHGRLERLTGGRSAPESPTISNVAWVRDHQRRPVLELEIDGHPAHIRSSQKSELLRRGIVAGLVFLASERSRQLPNRFIRGDFGPELTERDLIGCTDDPRVFALYEDMCRALRAGTWRPRARSPTV